MGSPTTEEVWFTRTGTPVVIIGVDEERLAQLYALEGPDGSLSAFTEAYETANLRTRTAWSYGYKNPRTTPPTGETP